jgi:hypothetical protein
MIKKEIDLTSPNTTELLLELIASIYDVAGYKSYILPDRSKLIVEEKATRKEVITETAPVEEEVVTETVHKGGRPKGS